MRIETAAPIAGVTIREPQGHPFVIEGEGGGALKISFENEDSKKAYLEIETEHPEENFEHNLDNPVSMGRDK